MTAIDYAARVAKGAALLDEKKPGWERRIDLKTLDIQTGSCCVTAQLSGSTDATAWLAGMDQLGLRQGNDGSYIAHGFNAEDDDAPEAYGLPEESGCVERGDAQQAAYATLNTLWRNLITARLAAGEQQPA